jgi:hypothetical protein
VGGCFVFRTFPGAWGELMAALRAEWKAATPASPTRHMYPAGPHPAHQRVLGVGLLGTCAVWGSCGCKPSCLLAKLPAAHPTLEGSSAVPNNHPRATNTRCHGTHYHQHHHHQYIQSKSSQSCPPISHQHHPPHHPPPATTTTPTRPLRPSKPR